MAMPGISGPRLQIQGDRLSGQDVRTQNVTAVSAIANIVKSSLGPVGLDKVWNLKPCCLGEVLMIQKQGLFLVCRCWWTTLGT
jgi:hypothetical protein